MTRFIRPRVQQPATPRAATALPDTLTPAARGDELARQLQTAYGNGTVTALLERDDLEPDLPPTPFGDLLRRGEAPPEPPAIIAPPIRPQLTEDRERPDGGIPAIPVAGPATAPAPISTKVETKPAETPGKTDGEPSVDEAAEKPAAEGAPAEQKEAKSAEKKDGATEGGPQPGGAIEGEADPLAAWRSRVSTATRTVPAPRVDAAPHVTTVVSGGTAAVSRQASRKQAIGASAKTAIPPTPKTDLPPPVPPEPDPVPAATAVVTAASDKRLSSQTFPPLEKSPGGEIPRAGDVGALSAKEGYEPPPPKPQEGEGKGTGEKAADDKDPNRKKAAEIKKKTEKPPAVPAKEGKGEAVTLTDTGPKPAPQFTGAQRQNIGAVLARILADPGAEVDRMLTAARTGAYPGGVLTVVYPDIGSDKRDALITDLQGEMDRVRKESGISEQELNTQIDARKKELEAQKAAAAGEVNATGGAQKSDLQKQGQQNVDTVAGTKEELQKKVEDTAAAATGENDPTVIRMKRERLISTLTTKVATQTANYRRAAEDRGRAVDQTAQAQAVAYRDTGEREARQIVNQADAAGTDAALLEASKRRAWAQGHITSLTSLALRFKREANTQSTGFQTDVTKAGYTGRELIRDWADQKLGEGRTWWQWLMDLWSDWSKQAEANTAAWETATAQETRDAIAGDFAELEKLLNMAREGVDLAAMAKNGQLNQQQLAILTAFFMGEEKQNPIAAVAMTLKMRIQARWQPKLIEGFEKTLLEKPDAEWKNLEAIGAAQRGGFNAFSIASQAYAAMHGGLTGWGTDEEQLFAALGGLTKLQGAALRKCYAVRYSRNLDADIADELSGTEKKRAQAQLSGDQARADAAALREAMHGGLTGWGTDEAEIHKVLRGKSEAERQAIIAAYEQEYGVSLDADLKSEMEDDDLDRANAYLEGNVGLGDAIAIHDAMEGGWFFGLGTDEKGIEKVYTDIRAEVAAQAQREGWTTARMEAEIRRRSAEVEQKFNTKYGHEYPDAGDTGALRAAFGSELSMAELELANALADADETRADAARLRVEMQSFVTDDDAVNELLNKQYDRALDDLKRDNWPRIEDELKAKAEEAKKQGKPWTPEDWARERRLRMRDLESKAQTAAGGYMQRLENAYDEKAWGKGALRLGIAFNTSGIDQDQALALLDKGYLTDVQRIDFAIQGAGTNEAALEKTLKGKTPEEVQKIREDWEKKHPGENFNDRILEETGIFGIGGGRERFDTELLLEGEPQTLEAKLAREKKRVQWELDHETPDGHAVSGPQRRAMLAELADLDEAHKSLTDPNVPVEKKELLYGMFERRVEGVQVGVQAYRTQVDSVADTAANIAGAIVAVALVIAGIVGGIFTGGATTVAVFALLTSLAATAASMATKAMIKGSNYSADEIAVDVAVGVVDAAVSAATAGLGNKLLAMKGLAQLATKGRATQFVVRLISEGVENMIQSAAPSVTRNLLNDKLWESTDTLGRFSEATIAETVTGTAIGIGAGKVMEFGIGKLMPAPKPGELGDVVSGDILARRGTPEQRLALFHEFKRANPDATMSDFLKQLDAGLIKQAQLDDALRKMQREMRTELLSGIPPEVRGQFADTPIKILSDADFSRLTKSSTGNAVILIENGKMTVVIREGAPLSVLREEGVHLHQSLDPKTKAKMQQLDESRLARWDEMSLDEQFQLYKTKLELEIDGQERLIAGLKKSMEGADAATMKRLMQQLDQAEQTLRNLNTRAIEVDGVTPEARVQMAKGEQPKPQYLDQPPRLFGKGQKLPETEFLQKTLADSPEAYKEAKQTLDNLRSRKDLFDADVTVDGKTVKFGDLFQSKLTTLSSADDVVLFMRSIKEMTEGRQTATVKDLLIATVTAENPAKFAANAGKLVSSDMPAASLAEIGKALADVPPKAAADAIGMLAKLTDLPPGFPPSDVLPLLQQARALAHDKPDVGGLLLKAAGDLSPLNARELTLIVEMIDAPGSQFSLDKPPKLPEGFEFVKVKDKWVAYPEPGLLKPDNTPEVPNVIDLATGKMTPRPEAPKRTFADRQEEWSKLPLDKTKHPTVSEKVEALKGETPPFSDTDLSIARRWAKTIEDVNALLGPDEAKKFMDDLFGGLKPPVTEGQYNEFRYKIRDKIIEHATYEIPPVGESPGRLRTPEEQWKVIKGLIDAQPDSASKGALFSAFREARLSMKLGAEAGVTGITHVPDAPRKIDGTARMVDGKVDVKSEIAIGRTPDGDEVFMPPGRYAVEDKAGKGAYDPDQAKDYSDDLSKTNGAPDPAKVMKVGGEKVEGVIYVFDDPTAAQAAALDMEGPPPLDRRIAVAYFGTDGKLRFVERRLPAQPES
jgi:hypothetical protein